jgi:hypothetical protein
MIFSAALSCDKDNALSQYVSRVQAVFEEGQARPVKSKSLDCQHGIPGVRVKVGAIHPTAHRQQVSEVIGSIVLNQHSHSAHRTDIIKQARDVSLGILVPPLGYASPAVNIPFLVGTTSTTSNRNQINTAY